MKPYSANSGTEPLIITAPNAELRECIERALHEADALYRNAFAHPRQLTEERYANLLSALRQALLFVK